MRASSLFSKIITSVLLLVILATAGCTGTTQPVGVRVKLERAPALYEPVEVTVTVKEQRPVNGPVEVWLALPPTAAFINGQMWWRGDLAEGESHEFRATIAFVAEGTSNLTAQAKFPMSPPRVPGMNMVGHGEWLLVTRSGGELRPTQKSTPTPFPIDSGSTAPWLDAGQSYSSTDNTPVDGSTLLNQLDQPRLFVILSPHGFEELQQQGLVPADLWGFWQGEGYNFTGVLDRDFKGGDLYVALYDRQRPTTGYHFAVLRASYGSSARQKLGEKTIFREGEPPLQSPYPVLLDIIATSPGTDWPVEERSVSPHEITLSSFPAAPGSTKAAPIIEDSMELVLRVNGQVVERHTLHRSQVSEGLIELPLPSFEELRLP